MPETGQGMFCSRITDLKGQDRPRSTLAGPALEESPPPKAAFSQLEWWGRGKEGAHIGGGELFPWPQIDSCWPPARTLKLGGGLLLAPEQPSAWTFSSSRWHPEHRLTCPRIFMTPLLKQRCKPKCPVLRLPQFPRTLRSSCGRTHALLYGEPPVSQAAPLSMPVVVVRHQQWQALVLVFRATCSHLLCKMPLWGATGWVRKHHWLHWVSKMESLLAKRKKKEIRLDGL